MSAKQVHGFVDELFGEDLHAKRVGTLADGTLGVLHAASLGIHAIGRGLASAKGLSDKHAVKQVDRCIGNEAIDVEPLQTRLVKRLLAGREEATVNLDWTEFDKDDQSTLMLSLQTSHGRAQPLMWKTVVKSELAGQMNDHEDALLTRFAAAVPEGVRVTVVADRGFGDQALFDFLSELGLDYIIRIRGCIHVTDKTGETKRADAWVGKGGRLRALPEARVTDDKTPVGVVVVVRDKGMKDTWCLVASDPEWRGADVKRRYGKRFSCEETFRDLKDPRFGFGLRHTRLSSPLRRDRLILLAVLAQALLTLLGEAGEAVGLDRVLKTNTSRRRTMSLLRQGMRWYERIGTMPEEWLLALMTSFERMLREDTLFQGFLGLEAE
ncbi:MAG: IS4 family transposase [Alphaproteobacteria bacterium]|nr:IS4 family transposase [Alphaproteobacteria bacterium]